MAFLGISYAKSPVGVLCFNHPEVVMVCTGIQDVPPSPHSWHQLMNKTYLGFAVMSNNNSRLNEYSLYLNILSLINRLQDPNHLLVFVMMCLYWGSFNTDTDTSKVYDGSFFSKSENVVLGSINLVSCYCQGMMTLRTMHISLLRAWHWCGCIKQCCFWGRPSFVILFQMSDSAESLVYHVLSVGSHSLFRCAILQSGTQSTGKVEVDA